MGAYFPTPLQSHEHPPEDNRKKVYECNDCGEDICAGDGYYVVKGDYYCDNCVDRNHYYAEADYWEDDEE